MVRWAGAVLLLAVVLSLPAIVGAVRSASAGTSDVTAQALLQRIQGSAEVPYSGYAESTGGLVLPVSNQLGAVADLFGGTTDLRAWYRASDAWRVDSVSAFGETDLYGDATGSWSWNYENEQAVRVQSAQPVRARLPRPSDLLPPELARRLLAQAQPGEVTRLPEARIAGQDAAGLRLVPNDSRSTITAVDVWALLGSGLPVRVVVRGGTSTVISTAFLDLSTGTPTAATTTFTPPAGAKVQQQDSPDLAATIDRFGRRRPPDSLAGLPRNSIAPDLGAIGVYGRGVTFLTAVPLPGNTADQLRPQLVKAAGSSQDSDGVRISVGPLSLLLTSDALTGRPWLLVGSVTATTLTQAAHDIPKPFGGFR